MKTTTSKEKATALKELIIINNDRYEGYTKAAEQVKDSDLKTLFTKLANESKGFSEELRKHIPFSDDKPERDETTLSGKVFRVWMDIKKALSANDRKAVLASCEFGEDAAKKTYDTILDDPQGVSGELLQLIRTQRSSIQHGHDTVKQLRDSYKK
ncbi:MAG TPA: PA2169 family four-helix-bundle protein [Flavobacteriales bacterium]|nr:PA2169 family four-helix-bundle protein [Flavobacteriales bacterium]